MIPLNRPTLFLLLLVAVVLSIITSSIPEAIGGLVAVIVGIVAITIWQKVTVFRGFNVRFSVDPLDFGFRREKQRQHTGVWTCKPGNHELLLRVMPNKGTYFGRIAIYFVKKRVYKWPWPKGIETKSFIDRVKPRFWIWESEDSDVIKVENAYDLEVILVGGKIHQEFNFWHDTIQRGGGQYTPAYQRSRDDSLWLQVIFKAEEEWEGHLQFIGNVTDDHRGFNRLRVKISHSPNPDMSNFKC